MKTVEAINKELDDITKKTFDKAQELCELMYEYEDIDIGDMSESEEDKDNYRGYRAAIDMRRQAVLKRILVEWGGLLYI
jgi:hypothetical protein